MEIRELLLKELREAVDKENALIKQYNDDVSNEMFCRSTVSGNGALANVARNACEKRANEARRKKEAVEAEAKWKKEMLAKYR